mmetsp:Transcript_72485/g.136918  ORF Transcript_72485/g.136918 Transcript_72485/m.136918 type:complete len:315 (+) Transcript_72485:545-1489(+)
MAFWCRLPYILSTNCRSPARIARPTPSSRCNRWKISKRRARRDAGAQRKSPCMSCASSFPMTNLQDARVVPQATRKTPKTGRPWTALPTPAVIRNTAAASTGGPEPLAGRADLADDFILADDACSFCVSWSRLFRSSTCARSTSRGHCALNQSSKRWLAERYLVCVRSMKSFTERPRGNPLGLLPVRTSSRRRRCSRTHDEPRSRYSSARSRHSSRASSARARARRAQRRGCSCQGGRFVGGCGGTDEDDDVPRDAPFAMSRNNVDKDGACPQGRRPRCKPGVMAHCKMQRRDIDALLMPCGFGLNSVHSTGAR